MKHKNFNVAVQLLQKYNHDISPADLDILNSRLTGKPLMPIEFKESFVKPEPVENKEGKREEKLDNTSDAAPLMIIIHPEISLAPGMSLAEAPVIARPVRMHDEIRLENFGLPRGHTATPDAQESKSPAPAGGKPVPNTGCCVIS